MHEGHWTWLASSATSHPAALAVVCSWRSSGSLRACWQREVANVRTSEAGGEEAAIVQRKTKPYLSQDEKENEL
jgi:hypothetical protein